MSLLILVVVFVVSVLVLVKSGDLFTDAAEYFGARFGIAPFIVGITIVAFGTSLPELVTAIVAVRSSTPGVVVGTVLGSNVTNVFLVLGATAVLASRIRITYEIGRVDLPLLFASVVYLVLVLFDGRFTYFEALIGLLMGVVFVVYSVTSSRRHADRVLERQAKREVRFIRSEHHVYYFGAVLVVSTALIYFSSEYVVSSLRGIASLLGVQPAVLAAGALALGTSLPELAVSVQAVRRGSGELAVGNVLGSSIVNSFIVLAVPKLFGPVTVPHIAVVTLLPIVVLATLLFLFMVQNKEITKWEGYVLLLFYLLFASVLVGLGA